MLTLFTKEIQGAMFGDLNPLLRHPEAAAALPGGRPQARRAGHHRYKLDDINQGYEDMHDGKNIRGVIVHDD